MEASLKKVGSRRTGSPFRPKRSGDYACACAIVGAGLSGFSLLAVGFWVLFRFTPGPDPMHSADYHSGAAKVGGGFNYDLIKAPSVAVDDATVPARTNDSCNYYNCFNVYRCGHKGNSRITVYIYPVQRFVRKGDPNDILVGELSREFVEMLEAIRVSPYHVTDPAKACVLVPSVDLLSLNNLRLKEISNVLASLKWWNDGENHIVFNMLSAHLIGGHRDNQSPFSSSTGDVNLLSMGRAILASGSMTSSMYRRSLDVAIPVVNPFLTDPIKGKTKNFDLRQEHRSGILAAQWTSDVGSASALALMRKAEGEAATIGDVDGDHDVLIVDRCADLGSRATYMTRCVGEEQYAYDQLLTDHRVCVLFDHLSSFSMDLFAVLKFGCIPAIVTTDYVLPFEDYLDWKRASILLYRHQLSDLPSILRRLSADQLANMQARGNLYWMTYMASPGKIAMTTLEVLNCRIFPHSCKSYSSWNDVQPKPVQKMPIFLPRIAPETGFTAVILTYDRVEALFATITSIANAPSLRMILVVWNNPVSSPPLLSTWPKISKPFHIVHSASNKLTNRFLPYEQIKTEAVLSLDDDISVLTADEIEFGYQVWREYSAHLVGFPARVHQLAHPDAGRAGSTGRFSYDSEWRNEISMVLTGAAFYHNVYNHLFTTHLSASVKQYIDEAMSCEDIAMNFLVANLTGLPVIKVTARKKFKCPDCPEKKVPEIDPVHWQRRTNCINWFVAEFGGMPLRTVEFRADPVLYKSSDKVPDSIKEYENVGHL